MLQAYFKGLYEDAMRRAYETAHAQIAASIAPGAQVLDCGASNGWMLDVLAARSGLQPAQYHGIEWHAARAAEGRRLGRDIAQGDLNQGIAAPDGTYDCVYALSVVEHLLNPCRFMKHCQRVLKPGGRLVLLTPNISTYFTAALILAGRMPSSGPHPDSDALIASGELFRVQSGSQAHDAEVDMPEHRHLVVFSFSVLRRYLRMAGFSQVEGRGFGLYPFPGFMQPLLERLDPWHCHQMVFTATR